MDRRDGKQRRLALDGRSVCRQHGTKDGNFMNCDAVLAYLPKELLQGIGRHVPPHQRGVMRLVCRSWCDAISQDVTQLQLPLAVLAPLPAWQNSLMGPSLGAAALPTEAHPTSPRHAALQRLFSRFPHAKHFVLLHNMVLPPPSVQAALSSLRTACPALHHVEVRDSVSWEQPAELAPLVSVCPTSAVARAGGGGNGGGATNTASSGGEANKCPGSQEEELPSNVVVAAGTAAAAAAGASEAALRELTITYLASPDMQRVARRWFSRELERLVSPDWSIERLRVRWLMGEAPRAFFTSRGFTRWTNAMTEIAPDKVGLMQYLEFAWAELSDGSFDRSPGAAGAAAVNGAAGQPAPAAALAPPLPPWLPEPYQAVLPPPPPPPPPAPLDPFGAAALANPAAAMAMLAEAPGDADFVFQAAMDGQLAEEEGGLMVQGPGLSDQWNQLGTLSASATAVLGLRGTGVGTAVGNLRPGLPLALCAFTNLRTLSLCCMASQAPADHLLRLLLRCRRLEKLSLVHHEAYASWPMRRVQPDLMEVLQAVVREELGAEGCYQGAAAVTPTAAGPVSSQAAAGSNAPGRQGTTPSTPSTGAGAGAAAAPTAATCSSGWWPPDLVLPLREVQLPATPALLALLHLPRPALSRLEVLDLQVIMAQGFGGPLGPGDQALAGTARLVAALKGVRASGAHLRDLFLNNVDLSPRLLEAISEMESLEQLLVFSGVLVLKDRDREPGSSHDGSSDSSDDEDDDDDEGDSDEDLEDDELLPVDAETISISDSDMDMELGMPQGQDHDHDPFYYHGPHYNYGLDESNDEMDGQQSHGSVGAEAAGGDGLVQPALGWKLLSLGQALGAAGVAAAAAAAGAGAGTSAARDAAVTGASADAGDAAGGSGEARAAVEASAGEPAVAGGTSAGETEVAGAAAAGEPAVAGGAEAAVQLKPGEAGAEGATASDQKLGVVGTSGETEHWGAQGVEYAREQANKEPRALQDRSIVDPATTRGSATTMAVVTAATRTVDGSRTPSNPGCGSAGHAATTRARTSAASAPTAAGPSGCGGDCKNGGGSVQDVQHGASAGAAASGLDIGTVALHTRPSKGCQEGPVDGLEGRATGPEMGQVLGPESGGAAGPSSGPTRALVGAGHAVADVAGAAPGDGATAAEVATQTEAFIGAAERDAAAAEPLTEPPIAPHEKLASDVAQFLRALAAFVASVASLPGRGRTLRQASAGGRDAVGGTGDDRGDGDGTTSAGSSGVGARRSVSKGGLDILIVGKFIEACVRLDAVTAGAARAAIVHGFGNGEAVPAMAANDDAAWLALATGQRRQTPSGTAAAAAGGGAAQAQPAQMLFAFVAAAVSTAGELGMRLGRTCSTHAVAAAAEDVISWEAEAAEVFATAAAAAAAVVAAGAGAVGTAAGVVPQTGSSSMAAITAANVREAARSGTSPGDGGAVAAVTKLTDAVQDLSMIPQLHNILLTCIRGGFRDEAGLFALMCRLLRAVAGVLSQQLTRLEQEGGVAALRALRGGAQQEEDLTNALWGWAQLAETLDATAFAADVAWRLVAAVGGGASGSGRASGRASCERSTGAAEAGTSTEGEQPAQSHVAVTPPVAAVEPTVRAATASAAAAAADPEATVAALHAARPAGRLRSAADEALLLMLRLDGLTRLTRLRKLCLDLSPDNSVALPVASTVRVLLRALPSLESLHITDQFSHQESQPMGALALPAAFGAAGGGAGALYDLTYGEHGNAAASANKLTNLTLGSRQPRRVWRAYAADASGSLLSPARNGHAAAAAAAPNLMALLAPLDRTALSGSLCAGDMMVHVGELPRNLRAVCLHRVRVLDYPDSPPPSPPPPQQQQRQHGQSSDVQVPAVAIGAVHTAGVAVATGAAPLPRLDLPQLPPSSLLRAVRGQLPSIPPLLQHLWLSNVTLTAPSDFAGLMRALLAATPVSGGLQTLVVRHCFVVRPPRPPPAPAAAATAAAALAPVGTTESDGATASGVGCGGGGDAAGAAAQATALRLVTAALTTIGSVGSGTGFLLRRSQQSLGPGDPRHVLREMGATANHAAVAQAHLMNGSRGVAGGGGGGVGDGGGGGGGGGGGSGSGGSAGGRLPQRLVLSDEEVTLLCRLQSLRTLALDSCLRIEDVGRLTALSALRTLALNPNVVASEEARARLDVEMASRFSPSLQAAIMRLGPLTGLRGLWLPEWAASRSQLLLWQSQLAALGPSLVTLRVMDQDNLWRLPTPAGCPNVEDSLQWWQAEVWNTI